MMKIPPELLFMHPYDFLVKQSLFGLPIKTRRLK